MKVYEDELNRIAQSLYNHDYHELSSWGQMTVTAEALRDGYKSSSLPEESLQYRIATLEDQLAVSKKENNDLWEENEALKMEIEEHRLGEV